MKGYYRNPNATQDAIDEEGWLHTGDKGSIDHGGFVKIVGRVKEQFKLSSGEYLSPSRIEHMLCKHPIIDMALVVGEKKKFAACLLFPDIAAVKKLMKEKKIGEMTTEEFLSSTHVKNEMKELFNQINLRINTWERLMKYEFIYHVPTIESGELTPTIKLIRDVIIEKYQNVLDKIYSEE